jgi:hypothetical protein
VHLPYTNSHKSHPRSTTKLRTLKTPRAADKLQNNHGYVPQLQVKAFVSSLLWEIVCQLLISKASKEGAVGSLTFNKSNTADKTFPQLQMCESEISLLAGIHLGPVCKLAGSFLLIMYQCDCPPYPPLHYKFRSITATSKPWEPTPSLETGMNCSGEGVRSSPSPYSSVSDRGGHLEMDDINGRDGSYPQHVSCGFKSR